MQKQNMKSYICNNKEDTVLEMIKYICITLKRSTRYSIKENVISPDIWINIINTQNQNKYFKGI